MVITRHNIALISSCIGVTGALLFAASEARADPTRDGATYFGGTGSENASHVDYSVVGDLVVVGGTSSTGMASTGAWDNGLTGTSDAFISLWESASSQVWSTYYGGSGEEYFTDVQTNGDEETYVAGQTTSAGFIASLGAYQTTRSGLDDAMLIKFDAAGDRIWGTYFGGPGSEDSSENTGYPGVCVAPDGSVYLVGRTTSTSGIASPGAHKTSLVADADAFIAKFSSAGVKQWSTYYGGTGTGRTLANACAVDSLGNLYVAGETESTTGIFDSPGFDSSQAGSWDAFLVKFNSSGVIQWGTYYGGPEYEKFAAVGVDSSNNVYAAGHTWSSSGIASVGAPDTVLGGSMDGFVVKFTPSGGRSWGTYFGGANVDAILDIHVALYGTPYVVGRTTSTGITTADAFDTSVDVSGDGFIASLNAATGAATYVTYNGGTGSDLLYSVAADPSGQIAVGGYTQSANNIATAGAFDTSVSSPFDAFITWVRVFFV